MSELPDLSNLKVTTKPLSLLFSNFFISLVLTGFGEKTKTAYNEAGSVAVEAIQNIRTVIMLSKEQDFIKDYEKQIVYPHNVAIKGAYISSFAFGFSQGSIFFIYGIYKFC